MSQSMTFSVDLDGYYNSYSYFSVDFCQLQFFCCSEDAETLRIQTLSESGDVDLLEKMVDSGSEEKDSPGASSPSN